MRGEESSKARSQRVANPLTDPVIDAHVSRQIERQMRQTLGDPARLREKVEVLVGERGKGKAATVDQLRALLDAVPAQPTSREVAAAPTRAQHNALVHDVATLYAAINAMRALLR